MILQVKKRNGILVPFDKTRIVNAINAAFVEVDGVPNLTNLPQYIADEIKYATKLGEIATVEEIQDLVEEYLMNSNRPDVARSYVRYRFQHELKRSKADEFLREYAGKIQGENVENSNANMDERSFGGRVGAGSDLQMKQFALDYCVSDMARRNHLNNEIYIHDLSQYAIGTHNCLSIPFDDLLANGFNTRQTDVRPAGSVNTAFQLVAVIFQLQSLCQFGGVSATHLDWTLVPYVRKSFAKHYRDGLKYVSHIQEIDYEIENMLINASEYSIDDPEYKIYQLDAYDYAIDMTIKEVHQGAEGLFHNLNTLQSRSGNQLPFTSINFGTCTLTEGRMVIKALLEVSIEGLGKLHKTPVFPCSIFQCKKGINQQPGELNYDLFKLALKSTSLRLYPNYANCDWSNNAGYDPDDPRTYFSTMGLVV